MSANLTEHTTVGFLYQLGVGLPGATWGCWPVLTSCSAQAAPVKVQVRQWFSAGECHLQGICCHCQNRGHITNSWWGRGFQTVGDLYTFLCRTAVRPAFIYLFIYKLKFCFRISLVCERLFFLSPQPSKRRSHCIMTVEWFKILTEDALCSFFKWCL